MDLKPNEIVHGTYVTIRKVGEGASGEVWLGKDTTTGKLVALKLDCTVTRPRTPSSSLGFEREAYFLSRVHSDYIAKVIEFVVDDRLGMVLVMEFIEGELLSSIIRTSCLAVEDAIALGIDLLCGVRDLHAARVIHRDLKPANVMVHPVDADRVGPLTIFDFSLSRLAVRRPGSATTRERCRVVHALLPHGSSPART